MCLAIPAKIIKFVDENTAVADFGGIVRDIDIRLITFKLQIGDYVIVHTGYAMEKLEEKEALESLKLWKEIAAYQQEMDLK